MDQFDDSTPLVHDGAALKSRMAADGFLFFRGLFPPEDVVAVRSRILGVLAAHGWLAAGTDPEEARPAATARREGTEPWWGAYVDIQRLEEFHRLAHHPRLLEAMVCLVGDDVFPHPNKIARVIYPEPDLTTPAHQDFTHIQGTVDFFTAWIPLAAVPQSSGGLRILRGSGSRGVRPLHRATGAGGLGVDVTEDETGWASVDYEAGDVVVFHSLTVHAGIPNTSGGLRLSCDFRYQSAAEPVTREALEPHHFWSGTGRMPDWPELTKEWGTTRWAEAPEVSFAQLVKPWGMDDRALAAVEDWAPVANSAFVQLQ